MKKISTLENVVRLSMRVAKGFTQSFTKKPFSTISKCPVVEWLEIGTKQNI